MMDGIYGRKQKGMGGGGFGSLYPPINDLI